MDHHLHPFDMTGPEFEGLSFDERFALKKQLRIRDRNRRISARLRVKREVSARRRRWTIILAVVALIIMMSV